MEIIGEPIPLLKNAKLSEKKNSPGKKKRLSPIKIKMIFLTTTATFLLLLCSPRYSKVQNPTVNISRMDAIDGLDRNGNLSGNG